MVLRFRAVAFSAMITMRVPTGTVSTVLAPFLPCLLSSPPSPPLSALYSVLWA